jgi:hypothetical protein
MIFGEEPPFSRVFVSPIYRLVVSMTSCWYGTGSQKKVAYGALQRMAQQEALARAREEFGRDLIAGRLSNYRLMDDVVDLFQFLELGWPADGVFDAVGAYLDEVLVHKALLGDREALCLEGRLAAQAVDDNGFG